MIRVGMSYYGKPLPGASIEVPADSGTLVWDPSGAIGDWTVGLDIVVTVEPTQGEAGPAT